MSCVHISLLLVVEATYLNFINHKIIEYVLYMFAFSYLIEVVVYTKIKNSLSCFFKSIKKKIL
jgi:hypothetical protein